MKISISLNSAEKSYISRAISKISPEFDQTKVWEDSEKKTPALYKVQRTDNDGSVTETVEVNSEFVFDCVDVVSELISKAKDHFYVIAGMWSGLKAYTEGLGARFEKWAELKDKAYRMARSERRKHRKDELGSNRVYLLLVYEGNNSWYVQWDPSIQKTNSRAGNARKDSGADKVFVYLFRKDSKEPIIVDDELLKSEIAEEQGRNSTATDKVIAE